MTQSKKVAQFVRYTISNDTWVLSIVVTRMFIIVLIDPITPESYYPCAVNRLWRYSAAGGVPRINI
jgi:hypothetical protein